MKEYSGVNIQCKDAGTYRICRIGWFKGHNWDHGRGDICKLCGEIHKRNINMHTFDHHKGDVCKLCGRTHKSRKIGHNFDHGCRDVCKKCGRIHIAKGHGVVENNWKGHNYDHGKGDICKKCGRIHISGRLGKSSWNKSLAKENNLTLLKISEKLLGHPLSQPKFQFIPELGHGVRSSWEKEFGFMLKNAGIPYTYEDTSFKILMNGRIHKYYPDFKINENYFVEIKGVANQNNISKLNAFVEQYPDIKLIVVGFNKYAKISELKCRVISWVNRNAFVEEIKCL